jgi:phytoene dehydrogenase-like protein
VPPRDAPFGLHAVVTDHFLGGAWTIDGGGDRLALALVKRLRALGGRIRFRARATAIEVDAGQVAGVVARLPDGDERLPAELVVANVHPKVALGLLPEGVTKKAWRTRIEGLTPGRAHLGVYLRVRGDLSDLAHRNLYRFRSFDPEDADRSASAGHVPFWFLTAPGARSPAAADGAGVVLGLTQLDWATARGWADAGTYAADKERLLDAFVEAAREDYPGWEVVRREASTPLTTFRYTGAPEGACYGLYHSVDQMGRYRVPPYGRVPGLWMVGQAVGFPGICGSMVTAYVAASGILGGSLMEEVRA